MILKTEIVKIIEENSKLTVIVKMKDGGELELMPFDSDLRGQIAALTIAIDCLAGKFYPARVSLLGTPSPSPAPRLLKNE